MDRVIKIANYVMKQVLFQGDSSLSERNLIADLVQLGYNPNEIEAAFKLLYSIPDTLKADETDLSSVSLHGHRIFSEVELRKLTVPCQGEIIRLISIGLLTPAEVEKILAEALKLEVFEVGLKELELILNKVITDEERLLLILVNPNDSVPCFVLN